MQPTTNVTSTSGLVTAPTPGRLGENTPPAPGLNGSSGTYGTSSTGTTRGMSGLSINDTPGTGAGYTGTSAGNYSTGETHTHGSGLTHTHPHGHSSHHHHTGAHDHTHTHVPGTGSTTSSHTPGTGYNGSQSTYTSGTGASGLEGTGTGTGVGTGTHTGSHHHHGHHTGAMGTGAAAGAAAGAVGSHHHGTHHHNGLNGSSAYNGTTPSTTTSGTTGQSGVADDLSRRSGMPNQTTTGDHLVPGMEQIGEGYSGPHTKRGDISAPTGSLPAGTIEKGATNQAIPRPSAKDYFKMSNAGVPANPTALANRPVHQDPISEADHQPSINAPKGNPGNMTTSTPSEHTEAVDPYASKAHGDHLVRGVDAGTGYAGTAAARGDISAPTGSLPPGAIEAGMQNQAVPRASAKDHFLMSNAGTPSNPVALAKRLFKKDVGIGAAPGDSTTK